MKIGFVFPGQGAQYIGMGKDLYDTYEEIHALYDKASIITGKDIAKLTFNSSEEELSQTKNTQICILTMSLGILEILKSNDIQAELCAGLSLGEYTALIYSQAINLEDGLKIVEKRGTFMQEELPYGDWSMAAILGLEDDRVNDLCSNITSGFVVPANYNCPGQVVVSGEKNAVLDVIELAKNYGAKRAMELKTSGPFHTEKLQKASESLKHALKTMHINPQNATRVIKNIDGLPYKASDDIYTILANHVTHPVQFSKSIQTMLDLGVDTFVEIGPGKVLSGFIKKINKDVQIFNISDVTTLTQVMQTLKKED